MARMHVLVNSRFTVILVNTIIFTMGVLHLPSQLECNSFFHNSILLGHTWGRKLLINTMLKAKLIERGIPELGPLSL
jgi:hypothetical protein